jgi:hypothetical protein
MCSNSIKKHIDSIIASAYLEGYSLPEDVIEKCKGVLLGNLDAEEEIKKIKKILKKRVKNG